MYHEDCTLMYGEGLVALYHLGHLCTCKYTIGESCSLSNDECVQVCGECLVGPLLGALVAYQAYFLHGP